MFTIHQVAISPGFKISSDEEAELFIKSIEEQDSPWGVKSGLKRWYSRVGLSSRDKPYYTWSDGTQANFIPLADTVAMQHLNTAEKYQDEHLSHISDQINGSVVLPAGEKGRILGLPVAIDEKEAQRRTIENQKLQSAWIDISKQTTIKNAQNLVKSDINSFIMLDQIKTLHSLIVGDWVFESMFYCITNGSSSLERFRNLLESSTTYADTAYLFAIEFKL
jgi:hypothetical protein